MVQKVIKRSGNEVSEQFIAETSTSSKVLNANFLGGTDHKGQSVTGYQGFSEVLILFSLEYSIQVNLNRNGLKAYFSGFFFFFFEDHVYITPL